MRNLPCGFYISLVNVRTMRKIVQIFVAFSEKLNFTNKNAASEMILHTNCTKTSVIYSFLVPDFSFKTDAIANQTTKCDLYCVSLSLVSFSAGFQWVSPSPLTVSIKFIYSENATKIRGSQLYRIAKFDLTTGPHFLLSDFQKID